MNAAELVAAIRAEHRNDCPQNDHGFCGLCESHWPCLPSVAADRIEAAMAFPHHDLRSAFGSMRAALEAE